MNDICFKLNVFWNIDENKNIYVNSLDYLFGLGAKKVISPNVHQDGFIGMQPKIENINYASTINFKNVRVYYTSSVNSFNTDDFPILNLPKKLKKGDTITFNNPVVIDESTFRKMQEAGEHEKTE